MRRKFLASFGVGCLALGAGLLSTQAQPPRPEPTAGKASALAVQDGLALTIQPVKASFGPKESPVLNVHLRNVSNKPIQVQVPDIWGAYYRTFHLTNLQTQAEWTSALRIKPARLQTKVLKPGESFTEKATLSAFLPAGNAAQEQGALKAGKYRATMRFRLGHQSNPQGVWVGEILSNPVEFEIATNQ